MRTKTRIDVAFLIVAMTLLSGCASHRDLVTAGRVAVEPRIDRNLRTPPEVYEDQGDLVVYGTLDMGASGGLRGHVDVSVVGPDGATLFDAQTNYRAKTVSTPGWTGAKHGVFRRAHRRNSSLGVYAVRFPGLPPEGSVVKVRHDPSPLSAATQSGREGK
jgi:hypothetical protein